MEQVAGAHAAARAGSCSRRSGRSNAFLWPSLVRIGSEAARFREEAQGGEAASGMSSPKRYLWDTAPVPQPWRFQPRDYDALGVGPMIDREIDLAIRLGRLPPPPPELMEAKGAYKVVYTSPLSRAMRAQEAAGFMRSVETVKELVNVTQDMSLLDPFDFDTAIPQISASRRSSS